MLTRGRPQHLGEGPGAGGGELGSASEFLDASGFWGPSRWDGGDHGSLEKADVGTDSDS